ncbi:uncharacterized protein PODANS_1_3500 [Podospora anserina S mat+]|uniref:Podospora anserina S mat+ genomic DNA chromosome 1, supercontig 1 n=1 Tax=Podospora anserina (strain S / ATCC MYA-4624 / DSM 980 / FGSC 10383) TaxID=515849 RepID=B2AAB8_PODAN|nr:uncharacterized protein PODANS_1_3500 [Podospora anserina S mat+]CAP60030.1 unnamed protein product [Podospora anserina S mat+]CDP22671.1 Putative protein of unknown function [Podospora anserina S mat+]
MASLGSLPKELLLHVLSFLEPPELVPVQRVSREFSKIARDDVVWRARCLRDSSYLSSLRSRLRLQNLNFALLQAANGVRAPSEETGEANEDSWIKCISGLEVDGDRLSSSQRLERERVRITANWDPIFPDEQVSWYDEYIRRQGPIVVSWFQTPYAHGTGTKSRSAADFVETRGVTLYYPDGEERLDGKVLAVSPLDDGSVCLWHVSGGSATKRGAIVARSRPGILFAGPKTRSNQIDSGVTECVSVDSQRHRAFFAVQQNLIEVDLPTLSVIHRETFPWSIATLSAANSAVPLTVGTSLGLHLHDYRSRSPPRADIVDTIDAFDGTKVQLEDISQDPYRQLFDDSPLPPYVPLAQPGPVSILHLPVEGQPSSLSDDIYVAGRFKSILHYDRRQFSRIKGTVYSGANLCSMTSLPYPFSYEDSQARRQARLSLEQVEKSKSAPGRTLIACGEYKSKGSLELYGLPPVGEPARNRQTCARSKLMSVVNHGSCLAVADGMGYVKWFERDGFTEVRRHRIGHSERTEGPSIFASMPGSGDLARKLLATRAAALSSSGEAQVNNNDLVFWTGEKLGLLSFSSQPGFGSSDFEKGEEQSATPEELQLEAQEQAYSQKMREALLRHANDVRLANYLGGPSRGFQ